VRRVTIGLAILACLWRPAAVSAQVDHLTFVEPPVLVECDRQPCFRLTLNAVDQAGRPVALGLNPNDARNSFRVIERQRELVPFYVRMSNGATASTEPQGTYFMVLLDISGSMNAVIRDLVPTRTRIQAAKDALRRSLGNVVEGTDHVAVVPFESHRVVRGIGDAEFQSTRSGIEGQVQRIPDRLPASNNTALYTAVYESLKKLAEKARAGDPVWLLVLSDGENDVTPADDPGLLTDSDLDRVRSLAAEIRVPITTVGFGSDRTSRSEAALKALAWPSSENYFDAASNPDRLREIFESARGKLNTRVQLTFWPVEATREALNGQSVTFRVRLTTASTQVWSSQEPAWNAPSMGDSVPQARSTGPELQAAIDNPRPDAVSRSAVLLQRMGILIGLGGLLALFWFGTPRMFWPEAYVTKPAVRMPEARVPGMPAMRMPPAPAMPRPPVVPGQSPMSNRPNVVPPGPSTSNETVFIARRPPRQPNDRAPEPRGPVPSRRAPGGRLADDRDGDPPAAGHPHHGPVDNPDADETQYRPPARKRNRDQ
jgi:Mg-chelatase subunit ChlD